jgi:hypothetical protein
LLQGAGKWKSRWAAKAAQGLLVRNLQQEGSLPKAKIPGRGEMEKPLGSESCAGLVGSEFGAGGIFAEGKNQKKKLPGGSFSSIYPVKV